MNISLEKQTITFFFVFVHADIISTNALFIFSFDIEETRANISGMFQSHSFFGFAIQLHMCGETIDNRACTEF
jgi:hypothetical protein